jgi:hypothetical protein
MKNIFHMNGYNGDVDIGTEDMHPSGGSINFPSAAAATTVVSSSASDAAAGTGVRTVKVTGLNSDYKLISETATMNGTNAVSLSNSYYRVFSVEAVTAGSGATNAGTIDVKHSATVLVRMAIGAGKSEHAAFTAPSSSAQCRIKHLYGSLLNAPTSGVVILTLQTRKVGGVWINRERYATYATGSVAVDIDVDFPLDIAEDAKLIATATANNSEVSAGMMILLGSASDEMGHP